LLLLKQKSKNRARKK